MALYKQSVLAVSVDLRNTPVIGYEKELAVVQV